MKIVMTSKISAQTREPAMKMMVGSVLLLLIVHWPACPAAASVEKTFEDFKREHVDSQPKWEDDPTSYCNYMMPCRNMTASRCKKINTFIHASLEEITAICESRRQRNGNLYCSNSSFTITKCSLTSLYRSTDCKYKGNKKQMRICVACRDERPVHYESPSKCKCLKAVQRGF
uniref:Ribonuclease A-domain domain-containing protein n=1 Tax=Pelusios castaneus TaxID=367368 RepID=A0A8C8RWQ7_9SAUR